MGVYGERLLRLLGYFILVIIGKWLLDNPTFHLVGLFMILIAIVLSFLLLLTSVAEELFYDDFDKFNDPDNDEFRIILYLRSQEKDDNVENNNGSNDNDNDNDDNDNDNDSNNKTNTNENEP